MKNNLRLLALSLGLGLAMPAFAQKDNVGIGTTKPDKSAALDINSTNKGLLMPRMTLQQRNTIESPAKGLIVYQTDMLTGFYFYDGSEWKSMGNNTATNSVADANNWGLLGNAGTNPANNFIGTTDAQPLIFKVLSQPSGYINSDGRTFLGVNSGTLGDYNTGYGSGALQAATASAQYNVGVGAFALNSASSGLFNMALGTNSMRQNVGASFNVGVGTGSLQKITGSGGSNDHNLGMGTYSLQNLTGGAYNVAVGSYALTGPVAGFVGNSNVAVGGYSLYGNSGSNNMALGSLAMYNNISGSGNIAIGFSAGYNETGSNKLYIANSNTTTPLVYGDFGTTKYLAIGEVAVADRAAAATGGYRLLVKGGMITEKIKVAVAGTADWADYVFEPSYKLMSLDKVESFVKVNKHLPNVPSAEDMSKNGLDVTQTSAKLMEKIEELTLYIIEMNKEIKALKAEKNALKETSDNK